MGGGANVWNNIAVYPLWATMAAGLGIFGARVYQWIGYDQDIQNEAVLPRQHALGVYQLQNLADLKGQETPNVAWLRAWFGEGLNARVVSMPEILFESAVDIVYSSEGQRSSLDSDVTKEYRGRDPADSDFLLEQGTKYYNHSMRTWLHSRPSVHIFPEPSLTSPGTMEN